MWGPWCTDSEHYRIAVLYKALRKGLGISLENSRKTRRKR
jgi:hypothetical protein